MAGHRGAGAGLEPEHLSCYGLKVEPGTPLDDRVVRGEAPRRRPAGGHVPLDGGAAGGGRLPPV